MTTFTTIALLGLGATVGASARYYLTLWVALRLGVAFPYGTLAVNILGCFILGAFLTLAEARLQGHPELRLLVSTGFCGSLTTFSTFGYETVGLLSNGNYLAAALNIGGSGLLGIVAVVLGAALVRALL